MKYQRPYSKRFGTISNAVDDTLMTAKLNLLSFTAINLESYLKMDKPMVPFLYYYLKLLSIKLLEIIVKLSVLEKCKSGLHFKSIDLYSDSIIHALDMVLQQ